MNNLRNSQNTEVLQYNYTEQYYEIKYIFAVFMGSISFFALIFILSACVAGTVTFCLKDTEGGRKFNKRIRIIVDKHD